MPPGDDSQYYKDPPQQILSLLKDTFGEKYTYFLGGPTFDFPNAAYPVCIVQSVQSANTTSNAATGQDKVRELIHVHFLEQSLDDENAPYDQDTTIRKLYKKIQGRDPATGLYLQGTAMYALRTNLSLKSASTGFPTTIDHDIQIDYDIIPRADKPTIIEALVTIVTDERISVVSRY